MAASDRYRWKENISSYKDWIFLLVFNEKKCFHIFEGLTYIFFRTPLSPSLLFSNQYFIAASYTPPSLMKFNRVLILNILPPRCLFKRHWKSFPYRCSSPSLFFSWATFSLRIYIKFEKMRIFLVIFIHFFWQSIAEHSSGED